MQFVYLLLALFVLRTNAVPLSSKEIPVEIGSDLFGLLGNKDAVVASVNHFFDYYQPQISRSIVERNLDPFKVNDIVATFWVIPPIIPIIQHQGTIALTSGTLNNLSTIERKGDAVAIYKDKVLNLDLILGFDIIYESYDFYAKVLLLHHYGTLDINGNNVHARVKVNIDFKSYQIDLEEFSLEAIDSFTIDFHGSIIIQWVVAPIINVLLPIFKTTLAKLVEGKIAGELEKYIDEINESLRRV